MDHGPLSENKTSRPQWDGRKDSRGTTQIPRRMARLFALTNISVSYNVEITIRTTNVTRETSHLTHFHTNGSRGNFN